MSPNSPALVVQVPQASTDAPVQQPDVNVLKAHLVDLESRLQETITHRDQLQAYVTANSPVDNLGPSLRHQVNMVDLQVRELGVTIMNLQSDIRLTKAQIEQAAPVAAPAPRATPTPTPAIPAPATPTPATAPVVLQPPVPPAPPATVTGPDYPLLGLMFLVLAPLAIAIAWRIARGGKDVVRRSEWLASEERIQRIEEAVDGIAGHVDRMSEGQRFLTNVLAEGSAPTTTPTRERERVLRR